MQQEPVFAPTSKGIINLGAITFVEVEHQEIVIHLGTERKIPLRGDEAEKFLELLKAFGARVSTDD
jgi:hypothetical protein